MTPVRFTERVRPASTVVVLVALVAASLAAVLGLATGHPVRIVAGLMLFLVLPGLGLELVLFRPRAPTAPWERLAVIGAVGLAASSLATVVLVVVGAPLTEMAVGTACAAIAIGGSLGSVIGAGWRQGRGNHFATLRLAFLLVVIVSGGLIGSQINLKERQDYFTILAFEDPRAARAAVERGGPSAVRVMVESHEASVNEYQLLVVGGTRSALFSLRPAERRVLDIEVVGTTEESVEIQLLKSGRPHRLLRLDPG